MHLLLATIALVGALTVPAAAQERHGLWLNLGVGWGSLGCRECDGRDGGIAGDLGLGATVSPHLQLGVGSNVWYKGYGDGASLALGTLIDARAKYFPSRTGGLYLTGGIGVGQARTRLEGFGVIDGTYTKTGVGILAGAGYDVRLGQGSVALTPFAHAITVRATDARYTEGQVGLALSIRKFRARSEEHAGERAEPEPYVQPAFRGAGDARPAPSPAAPAPTPAPSVPPRPSVGYTRLPPGTNYVGDSRIRIYYPISCAAQHAIPPAFQVFFQDEAGAVDGGFKRSGDC